MLRKKNQQLGEWIYLLEMRLRPCRLLATRTVEMYLGAMLATRTEAVDESLKPDFKDFETVVLSILCI